MSNDNIAAEAYRAIAIENIQQVMSSLHVKDTGVSSVKTVRFDGNNFQWWKVQIMALLEGEGLWPAIKFKNEEDYMRHYEEQLLIEHRAIELHGEAKSAGASTAGKGSGGSDEVDEHEVRRAIKEKNDFVIDLLRERRRYVRMREKAYSVLVLAMDQSTSHLIMNCESGNAHAVWNHLLEHFQRKTLASKLALKQAFHSQRMGNRSFSEYSEGIVQIANRLRQMGCTVEEDDKLAALFMGLNEEYEPMKISLMSRSTTPSFAEACAALADYSLQKSLETSKGATRGETAFYGSEAKAGTQSKTSRRETRKCFNCQKKGHLARDCTQTRNNDKGANKPSQGVINNNKSTIITVVF